jgi:hypothetical protein
VIAVQPLSAQVPLVTRVKVGLDVEGEFVGGNVGGGIVGLEVGDAMQRQRQ